MRELRGLYAVLDVDAVASRGLEVARVAEAMLEGGAAALQLRAKRLATRPLLTEAAALAALAARFGVPFFVNDRVDIALAVGAGVHLGQSDLPVACLRSIAPGTPFGLSTHTLAQLRAALAARPSYVAFGPVLPTRSKADAEPVVGLDGLREAAALVGATPLVAIGGLTASRAASARSAGASMVAAISGLLPEAPERDGRRLDQALSTVRALTAAYASALRSPCS
ncbi:MAG: thiamine phosphate synthase [Myxococcales bacterium]|nr:thiamine phosphate synthase [Myxococcales bacterium]